MLTTGNLLLPVPTCLITLGPPTSFQTDVGCRFSNIVFINSQGSDITQKHAFKRKIKIKIKNKKKGY